MPERLKVYLAGPEVFLPDGQAVLEGKRALAERHGFAGLVPGDLQVRADTPRAFGLAISAANETLMRQADFVVANMTPFRGVSTDVGTAWELGFMGGLGKPAFAYTNVARGYRDRVVEDFYSGAVTADDQGRLRGADGHAVEEFEMADNLMLDGGIEARGGVLVRRDVDPARLFTDLSAYEACLAAAAARLLG